MRTASDIFGEFRQFRIEHSLLKLATHDVASALLDLETLLRPATLQEAEAIRAVISPLVLRLQAIENACIAKEVQS